MLYRRIIVVVSFMLTCIHADAGEFYRSSLPVLRQLNSCILEFQNLNKEDADYGAILCPGENLYHTRAAEAVYPLAYEYSIAGNDRIKEGAILLGNWLLRQQQPDGSWKETPEEWTGTTTDQLLMLLLSYPILKPSLSAKERDSWIKGMKAAADYLFEVMDNKFASINYCATTTATLSEAYLFFKEEKYMRKASSLAHMVVSKMNQEYFIEGEGEREGMYKYGVDIGYNLEMSLWGLARYAYNLSDDEVWNAVCESAKSHFAFIYPDGMLDASSGIRSNKWTIYGSGTSDGCHPLWALLSKENPQYISAAVRNITRLQDCFTKSGLLGTGSDFDNVMDNALPCIYPTFTKAKSIAMAMAWVQEDPESLVPLPCDGDFDRFFQTMQTGITRRGPFCCTVTAYNYKARSGARSKYMHRPAGGAMSVLWVEGWGLLQASSQSEYHRWEPMSFPEIPHSRPLTPMISHMIDSTEYTNLYEFDATIAHVSGCASVKYTIFGSLRDREQNRSGSAYQIEYEIGDTTLVKHYKFWNQTTSEPIRVIEPFVYDESVTINQTSPTNVEFTKGNMTVCISSDGTPLSVGPEIYGQVYPALRAIPIIIENTSEVSLKYRVISK